MITSRTKNLKGQHFGRLLAIDIVGTDNFRNIIWECKCDCEKIVSVSATALRSGHTQSCGCLQKELAVKKATKHGQSRNRLYNIWSNMKSRCNNPNSSAYKYYGERGISVCHQWDECFNNFYNDMIESHDKHIAVHGVKNTTIERIDNNKGYSLDNCKWATCNEQVNNRSVTRKIAFNGESHTIPQWAKITGISEDALWKRYYSPDWSIERMLTTPRYTRKPYGEYAKC